MESVQVTISNNNVNNKVEFHGIKNTYPVGENVVCYFSFPSVSSGKPESNDWIGIFPVGWKSIKEVLCKKLVSIESQIGKVEFECEMLPKGEQYYQFVYVKNGELIRGASTPFTLVGEYKNGGIKCEEQIFGGKYYNEFYPTTTTSTVEQQWSSIPSSSTWGLPSRSTIGNGVEQIFGQVQTGLVGLEQTLKGLKTLNGEESISSWCPEAIFATKPIGGEYKWWTQITEPQQIKKYWSQKVNEIESVLREQIKIEYAHRKLEQLNILTQLKSFERHIMNVQKREQEIKEFLHCKMQRQIREFEQKVYNVMKLSVELNGQQQQQQQPEYYVKKYEQLLREKIQLDQAKRQIVSNKLRESIKECERKLREIQSVEFHFFNRFHQQLRNKIAQEFESKHIRSIILGGEFSEKIDLHLREQLKNVIVNFFIEQQREQLHFVKVHKQLVNLVCDMACKLQELECDEAYTHLRIPRISSVYQIELHPTYTQVKSLEQQIFDLKTLLRNKMGHNVNIPSFLTCGEWIRPIVQKLRELEWNLRQEKINFEQQQQLNGELSSSVRGLWFERRLEKLAKQMKFFEQHMEVRQLEEVRLREIFAQLKDLECELYELPQFFEQYYNKCSAPMTITSLMKSVKGQQQQQQYKQIVELCLYLQQIVKEKIQHLQTSIPSIQSVYGGLFNGECNVSSTVYYPTTPVELYIQSGVQHQQILKQLLAHERKVVELKSLLVEREHLKSLKERLVDLQQLMREITVSGKQQEKFVEQINRLFRTVLEQTCFMDSELQTSVFVPELYQTVVQKYEKLYQLINELESHLIEKRQSILSVYPRQQQQQQQQQQLTTPFEYEQTLYQQLQQQQQQITTPSSTQTTLYFIHQKFEKLVQEFLRQLPRQVEVEYMPKCEQIVSFLKSVQLATSEYKYGSSNKQFLSKELKEKMCEFERILCELFESEKVLALPSAWTITSTIVPVNMQSPKEYIRILIKLVRELRSQIQNVVSVDGEWELVEDLNNNGLVCEPIEVLSGHEGILADLVEKYTQFYTRQTPKTTTTQTTTTTSQIFDEEYVQQTPRMNKYFSLPTTRRQQLEREIENFESLSTSDLINLNACPSNGRQQQHHYQQQQQSSNIENLLVELESELVKLRLQKNMPFNQQQLQSQQQRIASSLEIIDELVSKFVDSEESLLKTVVVPENKQTIVEQPITFNGIRITRESNQF